MALNKCWIPPGLTSHSLNRHQLNTEASRGKLNWQPNLSDYVHTNAYLPHWKGVSEHCWKTHLKTMSLASCWVSSFYSNCHREGGHDGKKKKRDNFRFSFMTPGKLRIATLISRVGLRRNTAVSNLCMWLVAWSLPARAKEETSSLLTHPVVCIPIHAPLSRKHLFLVLRDLS